MADVVYTELDHLSLMRNDSVTIGTPDHAPSNFPLCERKGTDFRHVSQLLTRHVVKVKGGSVKVIPAIAASFLDLVFRQPFSGSLIGGVSGCVCSRPKIRVVPFAGGTLGQLLGSRLPYCCSVFGATIDANIVALTFSGKTTLDCLFTFYYHKRPYHTQDTATRPQGINTKGSPQQVDTTD